MPKNPFFVALLLLIVAVGFASARQVEFNETAMTQHSYLSDGTRTFGFNLLVGANNSNGVFANNATVPYNGTLQLRFPNSTWIANYTNLTCQSNVQNGANAKWCVYTFNRVLMPGTYWFYFINNGTEDYFFSMTDTTPKNRSDISLVSSWYESANYTDRVVSVRYFDYSYTTTPPLATQNAPANALSIGVNTNLLFNYTPTTYSTFKNSTLGIWFTNGTPYAVVPNSSAITNNSAITSTFNITTVGSYVWNVVVCDGTVSPENQCTTSANRTFNSVTGAAVNLVAPADGSGYSVNTNVSLNFTTVSNAGFTNSTVIVWNTNGTELKRVTNSTVVNTTTNAQVFNLSQKGTFLWNALVCDNVTPTVQCNYAATNYSLAVSGFLNFTSWSENTLLPLTVNLTITNGSTTYTSLNLASANLAVVNLPFGVDTVTVSSTGYYSRSFSTTINASSNQSMPVYLVYQDGSAIYLRLHALNILNVPIPNAVITLTKTIGGVPTVVATGLTDATGIALFNVITANSYGLTASATGFNTLAASFTAAETDYNAYMTSTTGGGSIYSSPWTGIVYWVTPSPYSLNNQTINFGFSLVSTDNTLTNSGLALYYGNGTLIYRSTDTTASGHNFTTTQNLSALNATGTVLYSAWFEKTNFTPSFVNITYSIYFDSGAFNQTNHTLAGVIESLKPENSGLSMLSLGLLVLFLCIPVAAFVGRYSAIGGGLVAILFIGLCTFTGFISWNMFIGVALIAISVAIVFGSG